jgi:hypothetical protein
LTRRAWIALTALVVAVLCFPGDWYPDAWRITYAEWFGAAGYRPPPLFTAATDMSPSEVPCPPDPAQWRAATNIEGVQIRRSPTCIADDPYAVAAFVRGTNNVSQQTLLRSGLAPDAVVKGRDLDGDGDPDEIHLRLEVIELNGGSPESAVPVAQFAIAPGVTPGFWVFAPKTTGMATENFASNIARAMLRLPSPSIRIEQGDRVRITLENAHYLPHTIHFHGVDHPFLDAAGEGNDGVPITSEKPVMPGAARTYEMQPRQTGTMFYHCHVQPHVHMMMGLQGMFIIEENRPDNWLQTLNVGAGHVRVPSRAVSEAFDREYDLHYIDIDLQLNQLIQRENDPRLINEALHQRYNVTQATADMFTLNGRSFPYTFRESLVITQPNERLKLRIANGGMNPIALHTHGHKATITHYDGVEAKPAARITRDVVWIATAQRVDLELETTNDGLHSYGSGVWLLHDHQGRAVTNNGIGPGGNVSAIVYERYLGDDGWPQTFGMKWDRFFMERYYLGALSVFEDERLAPVRSDLWRLARLVGLFLALGVIVGVVLSTVGRRKVPG